MRDWLRRQLKKLPVLVAAKRRVFNPAKTSIERFIHKRDVRVLEELPTFAPNSAGTYRDRAVLTLQAAQQTFPNMLHLEAVRNRRRDPTPIETFSDNARAAAAAEKLKALFDRYGSDKSTAHDYHHLYGAILADPDATVDILEIGLGTNNTDVVSNMGINGVPGASLRAFRDYLPRARIYGADVDRRILFEEDRIKTHFVDQTDLSSFDGITDKVGHAFDLIIDDGLHSPNANIATLVFALKNLKPHGWFVVEDICFDALPIWDVVAALLANHHTWTLAARKGYLFVVRKAEAAE